VPVESIRKYLTSRRTSSVFPKKANSSNSGFSFLKRFFASQMLFFCSLPEKTVCLLWAAGE